MSKLIVIEGGECAGKGTQIDRLKEKASTLFPDLPVTFTREPGGTEYAEMLRDGLLEDPRGEQATIEAQLFTYLACRCDDVLKNIVPAVHSGNLVFCDRFQASTFVYQLFGHPSKHLLEIFNTLQLWIENQLGGKHMMHTIVLDISAEEALARMERRPEQQNHLDRSDPEEHERRRAGYRQYAQDNPETCTLIKVDGKSVDEVHELLLKTIREILSK